MRRRGGSPLAQVPRRHVELEERIHLRVHHLLPELMSRFAGAVSELAHGLIEEQLGLSTIAVGERGDRVVADPTDRKGGQLAIPSGAATRADLRMALVE